MPGLTTGRTILVRVEYSPLPSMVAASISSGNGGLQEGPHDDDVERAEEHGDDQGGVVIAESQDALADDEGGNQAAAEDHGEETEKVEEIPEVVIPAEQGIGVQHSQRDAQGCADDGDQEGVEVAPPQSVAQLEGVIKGLGAPGKRSEGITDLADALFGRESDDDDEDKGDNAQECEQSQNDVEHRLGSCAEPVEGKGTRFDLLLSGATGYSSHFFRPPYQNSELSASILRTRALAPTIQMRPMALCRKPAAELMPRLWVFA